MYKSIFSGFLLLVATIAVIILAYYVTIVIGKKTNKLLDGRYTQILERTMIGLNINITILKINQKIYIIAMQGRTIKLLDIIDENDWKFLNGKKETQFNKGHISNSFPVNKLFDFNKIKMSFNDKTRNWNGSDNNE